jgi:pimeloyl-ACP methyl ester carboxylesterase
MTEPRLHHVQCLDPRGLHRMAYWEHGDAANPRVLLCLHGLSRQGRDFDVLAAALAGHYRVVCPDVVGRGHSDWLRDPMGYAVPTYVADMVTLLARLNASELHLVGTSMGGLIGMGLASLAGTPVRKLVINDVGPLIEPAASARISEYVGSRMQFASEREAARYLREISSGFGPHTDAQWMALTRPMLRPDPAAGPDAVRLHYDPQIAVPIRAMTPPIVAAATQALWQAYDAITCPTLLLRGAQSDLLSVETAQAMTRRGPRARLVEFDGVGHAPMLGAPDQVAAVKSFLLAA